MRLVLAALAALVLAQGARAGGGAIDAAAGGKGVWVVGDLGVRELAASTGRAVYAPQPTGPSIPLSVTVAGGAAWVASIASGYLDGRVTRIDLRTHRTRVVWRAAAGSAQYLAAGGGAVYLLAGFRGGNRVLRFSLSGRVTGSWPVGDAGRMAADAAGCWLSANGRLLHVDRRGKSSVAARVPFGDVAAGAGAVWLATAASLLRVDEGTLEVHRLPAKPPRTGGFQHDLAVGDGALWTLGLQTGGASTLERRDPATGRPVRTVHIAGRAGAVVVRPGAVWVATGSTVFRFDPRTLRRTLMVPLL